MREKKIAQETIAQVEFGFKTEKMDTNENVNYQFIAKGKMIVLFFKSAFRYKNKQPEEGICSVAGGVKWSSNSY